MLDRGHVDAFEVSIDGGGLAMSLKDDTFLHADEVVYRDPSEVLFQVLPQAATEVPDGPDFAFLGDPGDTIHMLPLTQDPDLLWPGWSTERIRASQVDGPVQLSITSLDGPGELKIFTSTTFGGNQVLVDSEQGGSPGSWNVNVPAHVHANWAFTETGRYTMTVRADAALADGTDASTGDVTYVWHVGDLDDPGPGGGNRGGGDGGNGTGSDNGNGDGTGNGSGDGAGGDGDPSDGTDAASGGGPIGTDDASGAAGSGSGSGSGGNGGGAGNGALAHTGVNAATLGATGLLLAAAGSLLLARSRRPKVARVRRRTTVPAS